MNEQRTPTDLAPNGKPRVPATLVGEDGNAFAILGRCAQAMKAQGWSRGEIDTFRQEATSGDYDHLLQTAMKYTDDNGNA